MKWLFIKLFAVLQTHAVAIHTNEVGGMSMSEPATALAVAVAIYLMDNIITEEMMTMNA